VKTLFAVFATLSLSAWAELPATPTAAAGNSPAVAEPSTHETAGASSVALKGISGKTFTLREGYSQRSVTTVRVQPNGTATLGHFEYSKEAIRACDGYYPAVATVDGGRIVVEHTANPGGNAFCHQRWSFAIDATGTKLIANDGKVFR
jgi:hypothetical protein